MKKRYLIFTIVYLALFFYGFAYCVKQCTKQPKKQEKAQIKAFEYVEPKDWYLDSTMTERRHIYYETQSKMK